MQAIDGKQISVVITTDLLKDIDRIAKKNNTTRAQTMRDILRFGIAVYEDFEKIGIVRLAEVIGKSMESIRKSKGQQSLFEQQSLFD